MWNMSVPRVAINMLELEGGLTPIAYVAFTLRGGRGVLEQNAWTYKNLLTTDSYMPKSFFMVLFDGATS